MKMSCSRRWLSATGLLLLLGVLTAVITDCSGSGSPSRKIPFTGPPIVVAHYMPWYQTPSVSGSWRHWAVNEGHIPKRFWHNPEQRGTNGWRDLASVYYPAIGPYDSADPDLCEYHILLAKAAGIDAFVADWYGPDHFEDPAFAVMRRAAEQLDFKVMLCWEDQACFPPYVAVSSREKAVEGAQRMMQFIDQNWFTSPAYLQIASRPVLTNFAWNDAGTSMEQKAFSAAEWNAIAQASRIRPVFIHDWQSHRQRNEFEEYASVMPWGTSYHMPDSLPQFWDRARIALAHDSEFSFLSGTVLPGFDNRGVGGWGAQGAIGVTPHRGGGKLQATWDDVLAHDAKFIQIATWNDFNEGATVEPTRLGTALKAYPAEGYGYRALEVIQRNVTRLKGTSLDSAALRVPTWIYACRKIARASGDTAVLEKIDAARTQLLAGHAAQAQASLTEIYNAFPEKFRRNPDLAVYIEESPEQVARLSQFGWFRDWTINNCLWRFQVDFQDEQNIPHPGRKNILALHPTDRSAPCQITRHVRLGARPVLTFAASANASKPNTSDYALRVRVNGAVVHEEVVSAGARPSRAGWKSVRVDLKRFAGQDVELIIETAAGGRDPWNHEHAFLADVKI